MMMMMVMMMMMIAMLTYGNTNSCTAFDAHGAGNGDSTGADVRDIDFDRDDDIAKVLTLKKVALTRLTRFTLWLATSSVIHRRFTTSGVRRQTPVNRPMLTKALQDSQV